MSNSSNILHPLSNTQDVNQIQHTLAAIVNRANDGRLMFTKHSGWIAVPVESAAHLDANDQALIVQYCHKQNLSELLAIIIEPLDLPTVMIVPTTKEGLSAFNIYYSHFNVVIAPSTFKWLIICTTDDYFTIMGSSEDVEKLLGTVIQDAYAHFHTFANDSSWTTSMRQYLIEVYESLYTKYSHASDGDIVSVG